jgi:drug/metabolite transporter (DMT)-like permease
MPQKSDPEQTGHLIGQTRGIAIAFFCSVIVSLAQALIKYGFLRDPIYFDFQSFWDVPGIVWQILTNPFVLLGYSIAGVSSIAFLEALHLTQFGVSNTVLRLNYMFSFFLGILLFGEPFRFDHFAGVILIFSGVVVFTLHSRKNEQGF